MPAVSVVIPNWNGRRWLPGCLESLGRQTHCPAEVIVVDNGSHDGSLEYLASDHPAVRVIALRRNTGFAGAANVGVREAAHELVALLNTDVVLAPDWLARLAGAMAGDVGSVACKMLSLERPEEVYDAGDILRRDGACEQRGRFHRDDGSFDEPGEVFGACAGAALYRRSAVLAAGGFDEGLFAYLEDVELALRLRLAGWRCRYEPAVAWHAGEGSSHQLAGGHLPLVQRNTLVLVARWFPLRWLPLVAYRQLAWTAHAWRQGRLRAHLAATFAALPLVVAELRARRRATAPTSAAAPTLPTNSIEQVVEARPVRGRRAGGHPDAIRDSWGGG